MAMQCSILIMWWSIKTLRALTQILGARSIVPQHVFGMVFPMLQPFVKTAPVPIETSAAHVEDKRQTLLSAPMSTMEIRLLRNVSVLVHFTF